MDESHTVLSDALDASGVYVGITRGRDANRLHIVAGDLAEAREQFTAALERDRADRGLAEATRAAHDAVHGLIDDGPVKLVTIERAWLTQQIERAERQAEKWEHAAAALARLRDAHRAEYIVQAKLVAAADTRAEQARAEIAAPLIEQATADGTAYLTVREQMWEAAAARNHAGRLGKHAADHATTGAAGEHRTTENAVRRRWGSVPQTTSSIQPWAEAAARVQVDTDPRVADANRDAEQTHREQWRLAERRADERAAPRRRIPRFSPPSTVEARAVQWRGRAERARGDLVEIETLPVTEAAQLVRDRAARVKAERIAAGRARTARDARAAKLNQFQSPSADHGRTGTEHDGIGM